MWLDGSVPVGECAAFGFAPREDEAVPAGSPVSFMFEGTESDGYLRLKAGQAAGGMSGAPLVCPHRRAVVGVVSATRDAGSALGGWGSPVGALLSGGPGVPPALAELGEQIAAGNRAAVLAHGRHWHAVLPIDGADRLLDAGHAPFVRRSRSSPADLLRADFAVVPYLFRNRDLDDIERWCGSPEPVGVALVAGAGGAGKSRFAVEACRRMTQQGWLAGAPAAGVEELARVGLPRLVVLDYAEAQSPEALRSTLDLLRRSATELAPVRVLLLTRTAVGGPADGVLGEVVRHASAALRTVLDDAHDTDTTRAWPVAQRQALFSAAVDAFVRAWGTGTAAADAVVPDLSGAAYALPLPVLFEAFDHALCENGRPDRTRPPVDRVLDHEQRYWDATAPAELPAALRSLVVGLATLAGAADHTEAHQLLSVLPSLSGDAHTTARAATIGWLGGLYPGAGLCNPLRPDRLGEALIAQVLRAGVDTRHQPDDGRHLLRAVLTLPSDEQVAAALEALARLSGYEPAVGPAIVQVMSAYQEKLAAAEPGNTSYARDLSISYERLGVMAQQGGHRDDARSLLARSVGSRRSLWRQEPRRVDLAEELGVSLYLLATTVDHPEVVAAKAEALDVLAPFDADRTLTAQGTALLAWARQP